MDQLFALVCCLVTVAAVVGVALMISKAGRPRRGPGRRRDDRGDDGWDGDSGDSGGSGGCGSDGGGD